MILLFLLVPLAGSAIFIWQHEADQRATRARATVDGLVWIASGPERELIAGTVRLFKGLLQQAEIRGGGSACDDDLQRVRTANPDYLSLAVLDPTGRPICGSPSDEDQSHIAGRDYLGHASQDGQMAVWAAPASGSAAVAVATLPWRSPEGALLGMITADLDLSRLSPPGAGSALPPGARFSICDAGGALLVGDRTVDPVPAATGPCLPVSGGGPDHFDAAGSDGVRRVFATVPLPNRLVAILGIPLESSDAWDMNGGDSVLPTVAGLWLAGILLAWAMADQLIARPVRRLAAFAAASDMSIAAETPGGPAETAVIGLVLRDLARGVADRDQALREAIATREAMLREIHHRVKNNLQIVTSLLNIQGKSVHGENARQAFGEIQTRVRALALVHRYLYESDDLKSVNLGAFLKELAASLQLSYGISEEQVAIEVEADQVWDISDRAVPLALFMTEAMTNALRHAFPQGRRGIIRVLLKALRDGVVRFSVEDNGVGLPEPLVGTDGRQSGLGMSLIKAFARQVDGKLTISGPPGTVVSIEFINKFRAPEPALSVGAPIKETV